MYSEYTGREADGTQVSRIKERVEEKEGIPPAQQRLIYGGKQMYVFFLSHLLRSPYSTQVLVRVHDIPDIKLT